MTAKLIELTIPTIGMTDDAILDLAAAINALEHVNTNSPNTVYIDLPPPAYTLLFRLTIPQALLEYLSDNDTGYSVAFIDEQGVTSEYPNPHSELRVPLPISDKAAQASWSLTDLGPPWPHVPKAKALTQDELLAEAKLMADMAAQALSPPPSPKEASVRHRADFNIMHKRVKTLELQIEILHHRLDDLANDCTRQWQPGQELKKRACEPPKK